MSTPNFKLLANALRLGQPPEPMAAFRVLVEVIQHQEGEIAELRSRLAMLASRVQFAEAKVARIEATGVKVPEPPPTRDDMRDLRAEEESSDGFGLTLNVRRVDVDAVVQRGGEEPYPLAPPGSLRPGLQPPLDARGALDASGLPFKPAPPLPPSPGALATPTARAERSARVEAPVNLAQTAEVAAADPGEIAEGPLSSDRRAPTFEDEVSYDDAVTTNILKRRPRDGG